MERPPVPPGVNLADDRRADVIIASVGTWILAVVAVSFRILGRKMKNVPLWLDDWLIMASMPWSCAQVFGIAGYGVGRGLGRHLWVTPPDSVYAWAIALFIAELSYFVSLTCIKWSILAFYWRSFNIRESIILPIWILATIVLLWAIAVIFVTIFQCEPSRAFWERFNPNNPLPPGEYHCGIDDIKFFYGNAIPTIVTDILILALPAPYIWRLQLPKPQKIGLAGIFLVGLFVTIVSIIRLKYLLLGNLTDPDITWNFVDIGTWSVVEGNVATICACLPFVRPVSLYVVEHIANIRSYCSKKELTTHQSSRGLANEAPSPRGWERNEYNGMLMAHMAICDCPGRGADVELTCASGSGTARSCSMEQKQQEGRHNSTGSGIVVTKEFSVQGCSV